MGFDSSIRDKIKRLAADKIDDVTEKQIMESPELKKYLSGLARTITGIESLSVNVDYGDPDGDIGWTDSSQIYLNSNADMFRFYEKLEARFVAMMGVGFHEMAHCVFLDFNEEQKAMAYLEDGNFYGDEPKNMTAQEDADWSDMVKALKDETTRPIFLKVFHEVSNIISDKHDEDCIMRKHGSFVAEPIYLARRSLQSNFKPFEDMDEKLRLGKGSDLSFAYNLLLEITRFDSIVCWDNANVETSRFGSLLGATRKHARIACVTDDPMRKYAEMNYIMLAFWPFIRAEIQKMQNQSKDQQGQQGQQGQQNSGSGQNQSGGQSGGQQSRPQNGQNGQQNSQQNGQQSAQQNAGQNQGASQSQGTGPITKEMVEEILKQLAEGAKNAGQTKAPENRKSSTTAIQNRAQERSGKAPKKEEVPAQQETNGKSNSLDAIYAALDSIKKQVATEMAEKEMEGQAKQQLVDMVLTVNQTSSHIGVPLDVQRVLDVTDDDIDRYNRYMKELAPYSKRLQKQMLDVMKDQRDGYVARHKPYGRTFVATDAYRPDQRFYSNKKQPQDLPDMAIYVLVDHSGSMSGERINTSMKAAMLLYDFATKIGIPVAVGGHCTGSVYGGRGVIYKVYTDFEKIGNNDKYRLAKMSTSGANRDGMALNIASGLLQKRPEEQKLLIIISDGRPADTDYGGEKAAKDIQEIVRKAKAKGVEVLAAAIGSDKKNIQAIYGDAFFDISDLSLLPKELTRIVKKRILANAQS